MCLATNLSLNIFFTMNTNRNCVIWDIFMDMHSEESQQIM